MPRNIYDDDHEALRASAREFIDRVMRRPVLSAALSGALLVALAIPALGMKTSLPGSESLSRDIPVVRALDRLQAAFPSENTPAYVVVEARDVTSPAIAVTSGYQRLSFPRDFAPDFGSALENWTVGVSASVSLLSGGRTRGGELVADANLREAQARLKQAREFAALDSRIAQESSGRFEIDLDAGAFERLCPSAELACEIGLTLEAREATVGSVEASASSIDGFADGETLRIVLDER